MQVIKFSENENLVLAFSGNLDLESYNDLNNALARVNPGSRIVLDLARIGLISSSSVGSMLRFFNEVEKTGGVCRLRNVPPRVHWVLHLLGLEKFFGISSQLPSSPDL